MGPTNNDLGSLYLMDLYIPLPSRHFFSFPISSFSLSSLHPSLLTMSSGGDGGGRILGAVNAVRDYVRAYFVLEMDVDDLINLNNVPANVQGYLWRVYLTQCVASLCLIAGSALPSLGLWTVLGSVVSMVAFHRTPPAMGVTRFLLLLFAAFFQGYSSAPLICLFIKFPDQSIIISTIIKAVVAFGCFIIGGMLTGCRTVVYTSAIVVSVVIVHICDKYSAPLPSAVPSSYKEVKLKTIEEAKKFCKSLQPKTDLWKYKSNFLFFLSMCYLVVYSQEMVTQILHGRDVYITQHALSLFTGLPAVCIHLVIILVRRAFGGAPHRRKLNSASFAKALETDIT